MVRYTERQVNLVKAASSAVPKPRTAKIQEPEPVKTDSRKRKTEQPAFAGEDVLLLDVEGEDYCEDQPAASTSRRALFGRDTPPKTPPKPESDASWQREKVRAHLRAKSRRDKTSSSKTAKSSSRRPERSSERKNRLDPYVKLTRLDVNLFATLKPRTTTEDSNEVAAQSHKDKTAEPAALASPRPQGLTLPHGTPEPEDKRSKTKRTAHIPRLKF